MQTFLPSPDFRESAEALDGNRRRNQRNECKVILNTRLGVYPSKNGRPGGWPYHPATLMWAGYEAALCRYALAVSQSCIRAGWRAGGYVEFFLTRLHMLDDQGDPPWLGMPELHRSHRSNLIKKWPGFYGPLWPEEPDDLPYIWPTNLEEFARMKRAPCRLIGDENGSPLP